MSERIAEHQSNWQIDYSKLPSDIARIVRLNRLKRLAEAQDESSVPRVITSQSSRQLDGEPVAAEEVDTAFEIYQSQHRLKNAEMTTLRALYGLVKEAPVSSEEN